MRKIKNNSFGAFPEEADNKIDSAQFTSEEQLTEPIPTQQNLQAFPSQTSQTIEQPELNDPPEKTQVQPAEKTSEEYVPSPEEWLDVEGRKLRIPRNLRRAIFQYESGSRQFDSKGNTVTSPKKARGFTQILDATAKSEGYENTKDNVYDNISAGTRYLRRGFDEAQKKGYDNETSWRMAVRGYLNGQNRQEATLSDGNVNTNQYEENVISGWNRRFEETGERDDDWNDEQFLTPLEKAEIQPETQNPETQNAPQTVASTDQQKAEANDGVVVESPEELMNRSFDYMEKEMGMDQTTSSAIMSKAGNRAASENRDMSVDDINAEIGTYYRQRPFDEAIMANTEAKIGAGNMAKYKEWLAVTKKTANVESLEEWRNQYNQSIQNDPTALRVRIPAPQIQGNGGKPIKIVNEDPTETPYDPKLGGKNSREISALLYTQAAMESENDPNGRIARIGWEEFARNTGRDFSKMSPEERQQMYGAYQRNLSKIRSISPEGNFEKIGQAAMADLINVVRTKGVAALDDPENQWIRDFALKSPNLNEFLRSADVDVFDMLARDGKYSRIIQQNQDEIDNKLRMQEMVAGGVYADGMQFSQEINLSRYYDEAGGIPQVAGRNISRDIATGLGFTPEEFQMAVDADPSLSEPRKGGTGAMIMTPEDASNGNRVGGNVMAKWTLYAGGIRSLMNARKAIQAGFSNVQDYINSNNASWSNSIRQAGADMQIWGNQKTQEILSRESNGFDEFGNAIGAGVVKGGTSGAAVYANLLANIADITEMVSSAEVTPFTKGSKQENIRNSRMDDMQKSAMGIISTVTSSDMSLNRFIRENASTSKRIIYGTAEGMTHLATQLPIYTLYGMTGGGLAIPVNATKEFYTGDLKSVAMASTLEGMMFGGGALVRSAASTSKIGETVMSKFGTDLIGKYSTRVVERLGMKGITPERVQNGISQAIQGMRTDPQYFAKNYGTLVAIGTEQAFQVPLPATLALLETNLTEEGRKAKADYYAIKGGKNPFEGAKNADGSPLTPEQMEQMKQEAVDKYENMTFALTAQGFMSNIAMAMTIPFMHRGNNLKDASIIDSMNGKVELEGNKLFATVVTDEGGREYIEYSGMVKLPSGKTEYMVIPKDTDIVRQKLADKSVIPTDKTNVDTMLYISRLNNRVNGKAEYDALAEKTAQNVLDMTDLTNPIMPDAQKAKMVMETRNSMERSDQATRDYLSQKKAEAETANRLLDEDFNAMIEQENQVQTEKADSKAKLQTRLDEINAKIKDPALETDQKYKYVFEKRQLMSQQVLEANQKPSKQADYSERMLEVAQKVNDDVQVGKQYGRPDEFFNTPSETLLKDMADHLETTPDASNDPRMRRSYEALKTETAKQYESLTKQGFKFEAYTGKGEPYKNSQEMLADLRNNKHLYFFSTDSGFGKEGETYKHPLMDDSGIKDANGKPMLYNDVFRAVHDALGHGVAGVQFGARGEHNATISHSRNYSDTALPALLSETSFQNAWVNYGKHLRNGQGKIPVKGEEGFIPATQRPFADQKVVNVTPELVKRWQAETTKAGSQKQPYSRKSYEAITKRLETDGELSLQTIKNKDQRRAVARIISEGKALLSPTGRLLPAKLAAKDPEFSGLTGRNAELRSIEESAKQLADITDEAISAAETSQVIKKLREAIGVPADDKNGSKVPPSSKEGASLVGQKVKFKSDNRVIEVSKETETTVTDTKGNVISKKLLELPEASKPQEPAVATDEAVDLSVEPQSKINLRGEEFSRDFPDSVGRVATDDSVVVNRTFGDILEEVVGAKFSGLHLSKSEIAEVIKRLEEKGYTAEAEFLKTVAKGKDGLAIFDATDSDIVFTTGHEFTHKQFRKAFNDFAKPVLEKIQETASFKSITGAMKKLGYTDAELTPEVVTHEILAYGLTGDFEGMKVSSKLLTDALTDVVTALNDHYPTKKVAEVVDLVLKDIDAFEAKVKVDSADVEISKKIVKTQAQRAGVEKYEEAGIGLRTQNGEEIRQAIADQNAEQPFVVTQDGANKGNQGTETGSGEGGRQRIGLTQIPKAKSYDATESELFVPKREIEVMEKEDVRKFLETDATSVKIMEKGNVIKEGQKVGVRLNLNVLKNTGKMIQTLHNRNYSGEALDYQQYVTLRDVKFTVNQKARELIASGQQNKFPMASVDGKYVDSTNPDFSGLEISFNPKMNHLFVDSTGRPIKSAEEAVVINSRVYARGKVEYYTADDMPVPVSPSNVKVDNFEAPVGLKKLRTDTPEFKEWIGKSELGDTVMFHGTRSKFDTFSRDNVNFFNLAFHIGTKRQSADFVASKPSEMKNRTPDQSDNLMPIYVRAEKPLIMIDDGSWEAPTILRQLEKMLEEGNLPKDIDPDMLRRAKEAIFRQNETIQKLMIDAYRFNDGVTDYAAERDRIAKMQNTMLINFLKMSGYDSIKYVNKFEGLKAKDEWELADDRATLSEEDFIKKYDAEYSYLIFEPNQIKSAIGNSGAFSNESMNILFKRRDNDPEVHDVTITRLTQTGDPFTFTGKNGAEHMRRVQGKADPVFNFFVKDDVDGTYSFENEFGRGDKPHATLKAFETKGAFRLYDVYQDYMPEGRRLWADLGDANAMRKIKEEGYDGFWNSNPDMNKTFRNRIALFDTEANRLRIMDGDTSKVPTVDEQVAKNVELNNISAEEELRRIGLRNSPTIMMAEEVNLALPDALSVDQMDFESESDANIVNYYMNHPEASLRKAAKEFDVSYRQIRNVLRKYDVPVNAQISTANNKVLTAEQLAFAEKSYQSENPLERKSLTQLADRFNVSRDVIKNALTAKGIKIDDAVTAALKSGYLHYDRTAPKMNAMKFKSGEGIVKFDSSYELAYMQGLDRDAKVTGWSRVDTAIPYVTPDGRNRNYFPDFIVQYKDGTKELIEVKPTFKLDDEINKIKFEAGRKYAEENGMTYKVVSEIEIGFENFSNIDTSLIKGDKVALGRLKRAVARAKGFLRNVEKLKTMKVETELDKSKHSELLRVGLKKIIEDRGDVPTSENERKASEKWLEDYKNGKLKRDKYPEADRLVLGEASVPDILEKASVNEDFTMPSLDAMSEKYTRVSDKLPKAIDTDAELIEIAMKGIAGKDWYAKSYEILSSFRENTLGKFLPETFVRLIGATGQGTAPRENFIMASKYLNRMLSGAYGDKSKTSIAQMKETGLFNGDGRYNIPASNVSDAMNNKDLSTRKLGDYTQAFLGNPNKVVSDEWMLRLFTGRSGAPTPVVYDYIEGRVRYLARVMNVTPTQLQAMLWVGYKQHVGDFLAIQIERMQDAGASKQEIENITKAYNRMNEGADFSDIADSLGLQDRILPHFPTAAVVAKWKAPLLSIVEPKALPKVQKGTADNNKLDKGAVGYYYDLNKPSTSQSRLLVDAEKLNAFLDSNPEMTDDFAATYESVYNSVRESQVPIKDLGATAEAIFRAAYLKSQLGVDIRKVDFNNKKMIDSGAVKKLGLTKLRSEEDEAIYMSKVPETIQQRMPNKATPDQVRNILANSGIRAEELQWMGLDAFLEGKDKITKEEALEFAELNRIQIIETMLGEGSISWNEANELFQSGKDVYAYDYGDPYGRLILNEMDLMNAEFFGTKPKLDGTKYEQYVLGGGTKYRELLLMRPEQTISNGGIRVRLLDSKGRTREELTYVADAVKREGGLEALKKRIDQIAKDSDLEAVYEDWKVRDFSKDQYDEPHWDGFPNVFGHIRFDERQLPDGRKILHVAEIQSQQHQEGRKKGYKSEIKEQPLLKELPPEYTLKSSTDDGGTIDVGSSYKGLWAVMKPDGDYLSMAVEKEQAIQLALDKLNDRIKTENWNQRLGKVPDAPFKKNWHELAFRRALKYAVDNNMDAMTWDTGETSADRYSLATVVSKIETQISTDGERRLVNIHMNNDPTAMKLAVGLDGVVLGGKKEFEGKPLSDVIGKEMADKIMNAPEEKTGFKGNGLKVGGEGMRGFYDKILPTYAAKFVKKFGSKVEQTGIEADLHYAAIYTVEELKANFDAGWRISVQYDGQDTKQQITSRDIAIQAFEEGESLFVSKGTNRGVSGDDVMDWKGIPEEGRREYWSELSKEERDQLMNEYRKFQMRETPVWKVDITPAMKTEIYKKPIGLYKKKKDEAAQIAALKSLDYNEWIDLATDIASNGVISQKEAQDIQDLVTAGDLDGLAKYVANLNREGILSFLGSARRAGLLTGLKTSARNMISNTAFQMLDEIVRIPASTIDIAASLILRQPRSIQGLSPVGLTRALYKASTEGLKAAGRTMLKGDNYFSMDDIHVAREKTTGYTVLRPFEFARNMTFRLMGAQDNIFRTFAEERAKYEIAWLKAKENGTDVATEYAALDIFDLDKASFAASVAVFQNDNALNTAYQNWKGSKSEAVQFMLNLKLPFVKTPSNIFDQVLQYSGIGGLWKVANADKETFKKVFTEPETRRAFEVGLSKGMVGFSLMALGYGLYNAGMLYGFNDDSDQALKKIQEAENAGAGHILLGGKWRDISSLSPISMMLLAGATYARQKQRETQALAEEKKTLSEKAVNYSKILLQLAQQSPFIRAGVDTLNERSMGSPFAPENLVPVDSLVPSIVSEIAQLTDPVKRSTTAEEGAFNRIKNKTISKIPILRKTLPATKDVLGNEKEQPMGFDPFASKTDKGDAVTREAKRLDFNMPIPKRKEKEPQAEYNQRKKESGDVVSEVLRTIVADPKYKEATDLQKKEMLKTTSSIKIELKPAERMHNIQVYMTRESLRNQLTEQLKTREYAISDEDKKKLITSIFSKTLVSESRKLADAKEAFEELKADPKTVLKEAYEDWKENQDEKDADKLEEFNEENQ